MNIKEKKNQRIIIVFLSKKKKKSKNHSCLFKKTCTYSGTDLVGHSMAQPHAKHYK